MCGFLVGGWSEEAREWGSVGTDGWRFPRSRDPRSRPPLPARNPATKKSPGRTTGALSERYISFVDSSFSSTHSFSRMTGFLSTRPSRSAGTR